MHARGPFGSRRWERGRRHRDSKDDSEQNEPGQAIHPAGTVLADGRERVMRTGRIKTTGRRKQRREQELVESDQRDRQEPHAWLNALEGRDNLSPQIAYRRQRGNRTRHDQQTHRARCSSAS